MKIDVKARYRPSHEWARRDGAQIVAGISYHAQESLGDIVFVELPGVGKVLRQGEAFGVIESVKAASDLNMPMGGKIVAVNGAVAGDPSLVNKDCYGAGWLIRFDPADPAEWDGLLAPADYEKEAASR
ncbi:MAG TPA: glycine cleavage system protein GcvH [Magnetospirillaceae bacterium]|nr:glycine cleavage system protein GcvH [Magnetospirillaceae bacterium]